jgi:hypothetical protein
MTENMQQSLVDVKEKKLLTDRSANFRGTACVKLEFLSFEFEELRDEDSKNVKRLKRDFETGGCWRLEPYHYVPALID